MIYLIIVNYYSADLIERLLASIQERPAVPYHVLVVNNSPDDQKVQSLAAAPITLLDAGYNSGFGAACNLALAWIAERDPGAIAWLLNPDTTLPPGILEQALAWWQTHSKPAIVGTLVTEPSGALWFAGGWFNRATGAITANTTAIPPLPYTPCDWVTGCSLMLNLAAFADCPQFDPAYFLYYEDVDFCQRYAAVGYSVGLAPQFQVTHYPSSITNRQPQAKLRYSTYGYLLTLTRYSHPAILTLRLLRLMLHAGLLLPMQPQAAIGKLKGIYDYLQHHVLQRPGSPRVRPD